MAQGVSERMMALRGSVVRAPDSHSPPPVSRVACQHYEHLHEQRYLNYLVSKNDSVVRVKGLDMTLFPSGRDYFDKHKPQAAGVEPVVIHNNYIVGKEKKQRRFAETGLWRVDAEKHACLCLTCQPSG